MATKNAVPVLIAGIIIAGGIYLITRNTTARILESMFPGGFYASIAQLDMLEAAGYLRGTPVYEEAVDIAYNHAAATCSGTVSWTPARGYFCLG